MTHTKRDEVYLDLAIELSTQAPRGKNYRVGALLVQDDVIVSTGYSWEHGQGTHAEENAFTNLPRAESARGATLYCSMAPCTCRSSGKECCIARSSREGIARVVYACVAPDEDAINLAKSPIPLVHIPSLESKAKEVNPHIFKQQ